MILRVLTPLLGLVSLGAATPAPAPNPAKAGVVYANAAYTVHLDRITEGGDSARAQQRGEWPALYNARNELVRPFLRSPAPTLRSRSPLFDVLHRIALADIEVNIVDGAHFRVSPDFHYNMIFTRDTAYASLLGAGFVFPDVVKSHLRKTLDLRRKIGFRTARGQQIPIPSITALEQVENLTNVEFFEKYSTHPYARRTDDVCWVPGAWAAIKASRAPDDLEWLTSEFAYFDREFYRHFFDPADNLYHGQASFIDIGGTGYPPGFTPQDSIMVKALSTNCMYAEAFRIVAEALDQLKRPDEAAQYRRRAEALTAAIRREFLHPDGYYAYFKHRSGSLEPRREQLGTAFAVLYGGLEPAEQTRAVAGFPRNDFGSPLFSPMFPGTRVYHNNAIWPFANMFLDAAEHRVNPTDDVLLRAYGTLARHALQGNFNEVIDYATGGARERHARQYIWSAAAYLQLVYRLVFGLEVRGFDELAVSPHLPAVLGGEMTLRGLVIQGTSCDITLRGAGRTVAAVERNGTPVPAARIPLDGKAHHLVITLTASSSAP